MRRQWGSSYPHEKGQRLGANANINLGYSGRWAVQYNGSVSGNYRNQRLNAFRRSSHSKGEPQLHGVLPPAAGHVLRPEQPAGHEWSSHNFKQELPFVAKKHTVGFLATGFLSNSSGWSNSAPLGLIELNRADTVLLAQSNDKRERDNLNFNLNYRFDNKNGVVWNIDADYGWFRNDGSVYQPNYYLDPTETVIFRKRSIQ